MAMTGMLFIGYIIIVSIVSFVLLFGSSTMFRGTPIEAMHVFMTGGCWEILYDLISYYFGERGLLVYESCFRFFCNIPHPTLQLFYLSLIAFGYYLAVDSMYLQISKYAAQPRASGFHWWSIHFYFAPLVVDLALITFLIVSFSDPGALNSENVERYIAEYPCDGVLYHEIKICRTCKIRRPPRSKHCKYCGYCVGRYDHHCGWVNTCIGERNLKYFILFLIVNSSVCIYGFVLVASLLRLDLIESGALTTAFRGKRSNGEEFFYRLGDNWLKVAHWILLYSPKKFAIALFLFLVIFVTLGFTSFQIYLLLINVTTNETFKRMDLAKEKMRQKEEETRDHNNSSDEQSQVSSRAFVFSLFLFRGKPSESVEIPNLYSKSMLMNLMEGVCPLTTR